jgi:UDP-glucose 4-epimerase
VRVFITGGAGFIGSHLCDVLVARGDEVSILDNLSTGSRGNIAHLDGKIKISQGDIRDQALVETLVAESELVLHMAAALGVNNILENPIESISTNFYGSEVVLNAAQKYDKRILIASTSEIYGMNTKQPLSETDDRVIGTPQKLRWTYSDAKALEEATAYSLFLTKKLKVTTVRFFNTVGPRQTGRYGMVLPRFVKSALQDEPIIIYGDGKQSRVFCHVNDAVKAILMIGNSSESMGEVYNVGGVGEVSILDLAQKIKSVLNSESKITYLPYVDAYPPGFEDMRRRVPDISKITQQFNWKPENALDKIISDVADSLIKKT